MQPSRGSANRSRASNRAAIRGGTTRGSGRWTLDLAGSAKALAGQSTKDASSRGAIRARARATRATTSNRGARGQRGRGATATVFGGAGLPSTPSQSQSRDTSPDHIQPTDLEQITKRREQLKSAYDEERKRCIRQGLIADPSKRTTLENAITPVGTCTDMCDEKERVDRIFELNGDPAEQLPNSVDGKPTILESRMVKKFRRAAAGVEEQMPIEIRTPVTLKRTLDYLLDAILGKHRLAEHHKFIWDRTRAIRNDFSIQQVTKVEDVKLAVECFERIARFHILSLHQLSNPANLEMDEHFEAHQEREQLNNTLLSLMYYYDDNRDRIDFPNEAEFKAYSILFEIRSPTPDLENRVQSWPEDILCDRRVQTSLQLYMAAGDPYHKSGPLRPDVRAVVSQAKSGRFWDLLRSSQVSYLMACVAEINFTTVRFTALKCLCEAYYNAPKANLAKITTWTKSRMLDYLVLDTHEEVEQFCADLDMHFVDSVTPGTEDYLDFTAIENMRNRQSPPKQTHIFSHAVVEAKRFHRTLVAVINGVSVADALRLDLVKTTSSDTDASTQLSMRSNMFVHEDDDDDNSEAEHEQAQTPTTAFKQSLGQTSFNPLATSFTPASMTPLNHQTQPVTDEPRWKTNFGGGSGLSSSEVPKGVFGQQIKPKLVQEQPKQEQEHPVTSIPATSTAPGFTNPFSASLAPTNNPFNRSTHAHAIPTTPISHANTAGSASVFKPTTDSQSPQTGVSDRTPLSLPTDTTAPNTAKSNPFSSNVNLATPPSQPVLEQQPAVIAQPASPKFVFDAAVPKRSESPTDKTELVQEARTNSNSAIFRPQTSSLQTTNPHQGAITQNASLLPYSSSAGQTVSLFGDLPSSTEQQASLKPTPKPYSPESFSFPPVKFRSESLPTPQLNPASIPSEADVSSTTKKVYLSAGELLNASNQKSFEEQRAALLDNMVRIGLTQKDGILDMFLGVRISAIVQDVYRSYVNARFEAQISALRVRVLSRKFVHLWKDIAQRRRTRRRTERRRKRMAAGAEVKRKREEELEKILAAAHEAKQIQLEFRRKQEEKRKQQIERANSQEPETRNIHQGMRYRLTAPVAGQKRKILTTPDNTVRLTAASNHKRSRTIGGEPVDLASIGSRLSSPLKSDRENRIADDRRKSITHHDLRRSISGQPLDRTQTDYFRLKAMGIDPDTPLIPETSKSLAEKNLHSLSQRHNALQRMERRKQSHVPPSQQVQSDTASQSEPRSLSSPGPSMQVPDMTTKLSPTFDPDQDQFLKQLREARQTLKEDREWFKSQTSMLEREIQEQEEFQKSLQRSQSSSVGSPSLTTSQPFVNSLMRSTNGLEYTPLGYSPGRTLSRTEQRIQQTGAHGLAVKVPSASPRPSPLHKALQQPVHNHEIDSIRKRSVDETDDFDLNTHHTDTASVSSHPTKRPRNHYLPNHITNDYTAPPAIQLNPFTQPSYNIKDETADDSDDGTEDDVNGNGQVRFDRAYSEKVHAHLSRNANLPEDDIYEQNRDDYVEEDGDAEGENSFDEDEEEDDDDEGSGEEEEEGEEEDDVDEDDDDRIPYSYPTGSLPPASMISTPESGPGATADDAIELSD